MDPHVGQLIVFGLCTFGVFFCIFLIGVMIGGARRDRWWWNEMIRRRHALYHWEDGKVYWNEDEPKVPRDPAANKVRAIPGRGPLGLD